MENFIMHVVVIPVLLLVITYLVLKSLSGQGEY